MNNTNNNNKNKNMLNIIIGQSASGKTTIVEDICKRYNLKSIPSFTTRKPRQLNEQGHTFVNRSDYDFINTNNKIVIYDKQQNKNISTIAYTYFNGEHYWADIEQAESNDFYIVDKAGIDYFKTVIKNEINYRIIYITVPLITRIKRLINRDGIRKGISRLWNDFKMFRNLEYDYKVVNKDLEESIQEVYRIVRSD